MADSVTVDLGKGRTFKVYSDDKVNDVVELVRQKYPDISVEEFETPIVNALDQFAKQNPTSSVPIPSMGEDLVDAPSVQQPIPALPAPPQWIQDKIIEAEELPVGAKGKATELKIAYKAFDDWKKEWIRTNPAKKIEQQKEDKGFDTVGKDLVYAIKTLKQVEPFKYKLLSRPAGAVQKLGYWLGQNPEVGQYEALVNGLASPVARTLFAEKGALAEGDVERAMALFPSIYETEEDRSAKIENIIQLLSNATGKDWAPYFKEEMGQATSGTGAGSQGGQSQKKPTHKYNPVTKKVEPI